MWRKKARASRESCLRPRPSEIHWWGVRNLSGCLQSTLGPPGGTGPAKSSAMHFWVSAEWTGACSGHQNSRSSFYGIDRPQRLTPACDRAQQSPEWVVDWAQCWHSAETQVIRTGQTTASCMCIYKLKKKKTKSLGKCYLVDGTMVNWLLKVRWESPVAFQGNEMEEDVRSLSTRI